MSTNFGLVSRLRNALGNGSADSTIAKFRTNQLGEQFVAPPGAVGFALEGSAFASLTPVPGTGIAVNAAAQNAFNATAPAFLIRNTAAVGDKDIILRRIRLVATAAGTGLTALDAAVYVDTANRYVSGGLLNNSGGNALVTANTKADGAIASIAQIYSGTTAIVASAAGSGTRAHSRIKLRTGIPVAGDIFTLSFGAEPQPEFGAVSGTVASAFTHSVKSLVIPPQACALIYLWGLGQTAAPAFEIDMEHVER